MAQQNEPESRLRKILAFEWEIIAGIVAAVAAIIIHFLAVHQEDVILTILAVLIGLFFIRDLRRESHLVKVTQSLEQTEMRLERTEAGMERIQASLTPPDAILIGPRQLRGAGETFARNARADMIWFNLCMEMFRPQAMFDLLLRPAIENDNVTAIHFILDNSQRELWTGTVYPRVLECKGHEKVQPCWADIKENVSFIMSDAGPDATTEALVSFWGEPFMAGAGQRRVPRYVFHIQGHSELVARFAELERGYRFCNL